MEEGGYAFVIMVKGRKALVSSLVEENRGTFETERDHSIRAYHVYGKTVKARLYEDDTQDRYFHLYFNPSKHAVCNLRRTAATGAFASGHPAEPNGHLH